MQALDKRDIRNRVIATLPGDFFYDSQSGNLILAMGIQGVVVLAPDGTATQVTVGRYSPTDFSFWNKTRTFFRTLVIRETVEYTGVALLVAISFAALALVGSAASKWARIYLAVAAAISAFLVISVGVYPSVFGHPLETDSGWHIVGRLALLVSVFGLVPLLFVVGGLALARINRRQLLALVATTIGMLLLIGVGALVLVRDGALHRKFSRGWPGRVGGVGPVGIPEAPAQRMT